MKTSYFLFSVLILLCLTGNSLVQAQSKTIFLVRHAEKADDGTRNPALNEEGTNRAKDLSNILGEADVEFIYSTNFKRTIDTGRPLATSLGKEVLNYDPRDSKALDKIIADTGKSRVLIVGHSNTIPPLVNQLIGVEKYSQLGENEYDKLFIVTLFENTADCVVIIF